MKNKLYQKIKPYIKYLGEYAGFNVYYVDGNYIRKNINEEFTNFGQHYSFACIPENELWIEKEARDDERPFFIDHLLVEYRLMAKGVPYDKALVEADKAEHRERRRADTSYPCWW